jgi:type II secretory pathway component GspD/PulD (secretin)
MQAQALAEETGAGSSKVDIQDGKISVSAKDIPLRLLCEEIEHKSGIRFRIQDALLGDKLSIELKDIPLLKGLKRLLAHVNYMLCFDHRNKITEVLIAGRSERYTPPVLRKPTPQRDLPRVRRSFSRPSP